MDAANTTSQAEQIKTDTHQTACVKNEVSPPYDVKILSEEETIIAQALDILSRRMRKAEAFFSSPSAVRDFLRLKMAELEFEVFSVIFLDAQHGCAFHAIRPPIPALSGHLLHAYPAGSVGAKRRKNLRLRFCTDGCQFFPFLAH